MTVGDEPKSIGDKNKETYRRRWQQAQVPAEQLGTTVSVNAREKG